MQTLDYQQYAGLDMSGGVAQGGAQYGHSNIYIKNLPPEVDTEALKQLFSGYGVIENARLVQATNPTGYNYGFVKYQSVDQAQLAISSMHNAQVGNNFLEVKFAAQDLRNTNVGRANGSVQGSPSDNLYVRNIPNSYADEDIRSMFSLYGNVKEIRILQSSDPARLNGALVRMGSMEEAQRAIEGLNNKPPPGGSQPLQIKFADSDEEKARKARSAATQSNRYSPYGDPNRQPIGQNPMGYGTQVPPYQVTPPYVGYDQFYQNPAPAPMQPTNFGMPPVPGQVPATQGATASVYIKNIPHTDTKDCELFLYRKFAPIGAITSVFIMQDKESGTAKGVGFVNYTDMNAAQIAIQQLNGLQVEDKILGVALQNQRRKM
eukprot:TRINITY_DN3718_c0_g2_i1.p1 TRINITY_DN3718_c0_g2~~TRINITY_DN3718_c0_g2_i1.p1  ORF type:complete len:376 (+),score=52.95 TRINITY_DN3718_c0_g2_i1:96-1223(+)